MIGQIMLSEKFIEKYKLQIKPDIMVRVGVRLVKTSLEVIKELPGTFRLSPELAKALCIKPGRKLQIRFDHAENVLHIGPTIGILTSSLPNKEAFKPNSTQAELIYLSRVAENIPAQAYIFTPNCIDWDNYTTRGYLYKYDADHQGFWESFTYPLPDVVYDRIPSRSSENRNLIKSTKNRLISLPQLKYFNPSFLNKWRVYQLLSTNRHLVPYMPETRVLTQENLSIMLAKYQQLFVKPSNGSLGKGIIKIDSTGGGKMNYTIYGRGRKHGVADSSAEFLKKTHSQRLKKPYIVQRGIDLAKYKDSAFDIRIIYQKNGAGQWTIGKKFVRVAAPGSSISNLSSGGTAERSKTVLANILNRNKNHIEAKNIEMRKLCEMIASTLEGVSQQIFGELGLDIGIDKQGNLWLIEVNSKPRKTTETEMSQSIVYNSFKRPLEYAIYLAGFNQTDDNQL